MAVGEGGGMGGGEGWEEGRDGSRYIHNIIRRGNSGIEYSRYSRCPQKVSPLYPYYGWSFKKKRAANEH